RGALEQRTQGAESHSELLDVDARERGRCRKSKCHGGRHRLPLTHARPDHAHRGEALSRRRETTPRDGADVESLLQPTAVRPRVPEAVLKDLPLRPALGGVQLDRPCRTADAVLELAAAEYVVARELVVAPDAARLAQPEARGGVGEKGLVESGHVRAQ